VRHRHPRHRGRADRVLPHRLPVSVPPAPEGRALNLELVTIGTELLLGHTIDTNGAELGRALSAAGVDVVRKPTVPDRPKAIAAAIRAALERTGFVLATGGLGPTRDDMTKKVVADLLGKALYVDDALLKALEARFKRHGWDKMPAINRNQAEVPEGATV